jgi:hypothetical protein
VVMRGSVFDAWLGLVFDSKDMIDNEIEKNKQVGRSEGAGECKSLCWGFYDSLYERNQTHF